MSGHTPGELVDALRSGRYRQAKRVLHDSQSGGYCCLGVAAVEAGIPDSSLLLFVYPFHMRTEDRVQFEEYWPWLTETLYTELAKANDGDVSGTFQEPIRLLKEQFPGLDLDAV